MGPAPGLPGIASNVSTKFPTRAQPPEKSGIFSAPPVCGSANTGHAKPPRKTPSNKADLGIVAPVTAKDAAMLRFFGEEAQCRDVKRGGVRRALTVGVYG